MTSIPAAWRFLIPVTLLLMVSAFLLALRETSGEMGEIQINAETQVADLARLLTVSESLVGEQVKSSMALLKQRGALSGKPRIKGEVHMESGNIPALYLGGVPQTNDFRLVDEVTNLLGGTATLFVKAGDKFIRISTNVQNAKGNRALGTILDPQGQAIKAINEGKPFYGVVDILGQPYFTGYEPMLDQGGKLIGIWYVGYKVDMQVLREAVEGTRFLESGFSAVKDDSGEVRFLSAHVAKVFAQDVASVPVKGWIVVKKYLPTWKFEVLVAYPEKEARALGLAKVAYIVLNITALGLILIVVISTQFYRLVLRPLGG